MPGAEGQGVRVDKLEGRDAVVAVLGHYGNRNLGDEAITVAMLAGLRRHVQSVRPVCVSMDPADSARRHGVPAFPLRRTARSPAVVDPVSVTVEPAAPAADEAVTGAQTGAVGTSRRLLRPLRRLARIGLDGLAEVLFLGRVFRFVRGTDLVVITGSNQFLDNFGGFAGFPWTLLKWSLLTRLAGARLAIVAVGAGPLNGRLARASARLVLRLAHHASFRDAASRDLVAQGARQRGDVCPDLAFSLPVAPAERRDRVERIGINPMPVFDARYWPDADAGRYQAFVAAMTAVVEGVRALGATPFLFPTQPGDLHVITDIEARLAARGAHPVEVERPETVEALMDVLASADLVVPTRFHGTVLALVRGRPVVSICYHRKTTDVMASFGLGDAAFPIETLDPNAVVARVQALIERVPGIHEAIDSAGSDHRKALEEQFASLAALLPANRAAAGGPAAVRP